MLFVCAMTTTIASCWTLTADFSDLEGQGTSSVDARVVGDGENRAGDAATNADVDASTPLADGSFCQRAGAHALCDDFEDGPLGARWPQVAEGSGGTLALATDTGSSGRALRAALPATCNDSFAQLLHTFNGSPRSATISFSMNVESATANVGVQIAGLNYKTAAGEYHIDMALLDSHLSVFENDIGGGGFKVLGTSVASFPTTQRLRLDLEIVFVPSPARFTVKVDGVPSLEVTPTPSDPSDTMARFDLGLYAHTGCVSPSTLTFDDVLFDFVPR